MAATVSWIVVVAGYIIALWIIVRVVLQRREPTATLAWVLGVLLLPYLGALAYVTIGRRRLRRQARQRQAFAGAIEPFLARFGERIGELTVDASGVRHLPRPGDNELMRLSNRIGMRLPTVGNEVALFVDADKSYRALEEAIDAARLHVNFEYYIFQEDETGRRFRDLLIEKAKGGVQVRVLTDGVGSYGINDFMVPLIEAGGRFAEFQPVGFRRNWYRANLRNHRKIVVVDGELAFTGGVNIGDEYTGRTERAGLWRDAHLQIRGPAVHHLQEVFIEDWHFATGEDPSNESWFPAQQAHGDVMVQIVASGPDTDTQPIQRIFFTAVTSAKERVYLTTPYFVPDQAMLVALETAALRGLDVRLLLPFRSDMRLVLHAGRSYYDELMEAGVRIYEYQRGILHAKTMVVDHHWATVGSANMDVRSFKLNFEVNAAIYGSGFANGLADVFMRDLEASREVTRGELLGRSTRRRAIEGFARTLSPLL